ncbi:MAG: FAD-dependent oxidoreductase [Acidobacteriota bacterium]
MTDPQMPIRVAVIGGGCAALTTAFELSRPEHQGRYQITVYQMGWRLGGKGASGRGASDRIEEHGLHLWMGFYENAFQLMRECYAERHTAFPNFRFADWRDAFKPAPDVAVADCTPAGWEFWLAHFPPGQGMPGDPKTGDPFTVIAYLRQSVTLIGELLRSAAAKEAATQLDDTTTAASEGNTRGPDAIASAVSYLLRYGQLGTLAALLEASDLLGEAIQGFFPQMFRDGAAVPLQILDGLTAAVRRNLEKLVESDRELRRVWLVIDLILAILRGAIRSNLALDPQGFDAINHYDWREWLQLNGASEQALDSGFMRGIYDLAFAFEDGDVSRPRLAAGVALRGAMRMFFTYRGSLFWRMSAGMGDIVFAPLYQVLQQRGVRFEFFHRLRNVGLSPAAVGPAPYVETLEFDVQARVKGGGEYQPLVDIRNVPSWPSVPDYQQLVNGRTLTRERRGFEAVWETRKAATKTLQVTRDFDFVVLGVSIGALPDVARELIERAPSWRDMVRHVKTVPTQALQLWMRKDLAQLGWPHPSVNLSGFVEPFDTWADMSHLIPEESWKDQVKSIAYFCSVLPDPTTDGGSVTEQLQQEQSEVVRNNSVRFLQDDVSALWPQAKQGGSFAWDALADDRPSKGVADDRRIDSQFWRANINPTDRYVQSLPGSSVYRLSPLDMTFDNLTIAGDWTATGLDTGCIESAVISGRLAAHAISQKPALEEIVGYDHP